MNTQPTLLRMLRTTTFNFQPPGKGKYEPSEMTQEVFFRDTTRNIDYTFWLNPETNNIRVSALHKNHTLLLFTPTIAIGTRRFAPDIILSLHTLFEFDFASDASITVHNNLVTYSHHHTPTKQTNTASDASTRQPPIIPVYRRNRWHRIFRAFLLLRP